ncbi:MAG: hypothetical protein AAF533_17895 [Acidobacteriota bacterium]
MIVSGLLALVTGVSLISSRSVSPETHLAVERTELAVRLYDAAHQAREADATDEADFALERSCQLGHEPACQAVWLRLDFEIADASRAEQAASWTDGIVFLNRRDGVLKARLYCPTTQRQRLALLKSRFE